MFKDIDLSKESVKAFKLTKIGAEKARERDLHVNILSQAAWPSYPETRVEIPPCLAEHLEAFAKFYLSKHKGKKLIWQHGLSHCVLKADFPFVCSAPQICWVMANDGDSLRRAKKNFFSPPSRPRSCYRSTKRLALAS
jgi:hypothetical protein